MAPPEAEARQVVLPYYRRQHTLLAEMFAQAATQHGNMLGRQARYALALRGMIDSYVLAVLDGYAVFSETLVHELVHQFSHGIYS
jgi:TetR/AcrR family transcriptional regulator